MTEEEIEKLARELADELYNDDKTYNSILWWCEEPKERKAEELVHTLHFLLRSHCIVPKSKVMKEYEFNHQAAIGEAIRTGDMANKYILKRDLLDELFGSQLGKEAKE